MSAIKVPGQLAVAQVAELRGIINLDFEDVENAIVAAIEADRAQRNLLTEAEHTERYRDNDLSIEVPHDVVVEGWKDVTETPTRAILRLNAEAIGYASLAAQANERADKAEAALRAIHDVLEGM